MLWKTFLAPSKHPLFKRIITKGSPIFFKQVSTKPVFLNGSLCQTSQHKAYIFKWFLCQINQHKAIILKWFPLPNKSVQSQYFLMVPFAKQVSTKSIPLPNKSAQSLYFAKQVSTKPIFLNETISYQTSLFFLVFNMASYESPKPSIFNRFVVCSKFWDR